MKLNWFDYWIGHCWMSGWQSIRSTFSIWCDLMSSRYQDYGLLFGDDPEQECKEWFWISLGEDNTYPKEFLEHLQQMVDDIETGKVKPIPLTEDFFDSLKDLTDGIDVNLDEELNDGNV